jgi:hypothetical protein
VLRREGQIPYRSGRATRRHGYQQLLGCGYEQPGARTCDGIDSDALAPLDRGNIDVARTADRENMIACQEKVVRIAAGRA